MDLGIRGRKAIVCASSQGLGKGCALALAEAGVSLVINGRNRLSLERTAEEIRRASATVADKNVTINNLLPGSFDTERLRGGLRAAAKREGKSDSEVARHAQEAIPAKRFGTPSELGQTCAFLCSVHAGYITGQNILLDGGAYPAAF